MDRERRRRLVTIGLNFCVFGTLFIKKMPLHSLLASKKKDREHILQTGEGIEPRRCLRLNRDQYHDLLRRLTPLIEKQNANKREAIW